MHQEVHVYLSDWRCCTGEEEVEEGVVQWKRKEERVTYIYPGRPPFSSSALYDSLPPSSISNISSAFSGVRKRESGRKEGRRKGPWPWQHPPPIPLLFSAVVEKKSEKRGEARRRNTLLCPPRLWKLASEKRRAFQLACLSV